jgi:hypothetical protein
VPPGGYLARRLGFGAAVLASTVVFGASLAGIAGVDAELQRAERGLLSAGQAVSPVSDSARSEQHYADCPWRDHPARGQADS